MDEEMVFSLSYEQLTRIAEKNIRECGLGQDSLGTRYISELKASALLWLWYELAIHGVPQNNYARAWERIDADHQRLRKLIWPEN
ncbi:hypothetical protein, partial [Escherichia coli]